MTSPNRTTRIFAALPLLALLGRVGGGPARAGTERVQVLVHVEVAQRVGRAVHIADAHVAREHTGRLVQRRGDPIRDLLLPIARGIPGYEHKKKGEHGGGEATAGRAGGGAGTAGEGTTPG